jgi:hypothetical protein
MVTGMPLPSVRSQHGAMTTTDIHSAAPQPSRIGEVARRLGRLSALLSKPMAGRRFVTIWATISCIGRRSGKAYTLPVAIGTTPDSFVIPLPFSGAQWVLNVMAAGECVIRWNGREWRATKPEVIEADEAAWAFGPVPRLGIKAIGLNRFLRLSRAEA